MHEDLHKVNFFQGLNPSKEPKPKLQPGQRVRKTKAGIETCVAPRSNEGTFVRYMRDGRLVVHVDGYAKSSCTGGWHPDFWEAEP